MIGYNFRDLAQEVLDITKQPMSAEQIWQKANEVGLAEKVGSKGKTPARSIQAQLYVDIKERDNSNFVQLSKHPVLFGLKSLSYGDSDIEGVSENINDGESVIDTTGKKQLKSPWDERDLHPLLAPSLDGWLHPASAPAASAPARRSDTIFVNFMSYVIPFSKTTVHAAKLTMANITRLLFSKTSLAGLGFPKSERNAKRCGRNPQRNVERRRAVSLFRKRGSG